MLVTAAAAYLYWGLGIAMTPLVAVHFAREAERKGIKLDFLFLLALLWAANAAWQFGLSSSAALLMATPGHFLEKNIGILPLSTTIWSPAAIILEVSFVAILIVVGLSADAEELPARLRVPGRLQAERGRKANRSGSRELLRTPRTQPDRSAGDLRWFWRAGCTITLALNISAST